MKIDVIIHQFVQKNIDEHLLSELDRIYATNQILSYLHIDSIENIDQNQFIEIDRLDLLDQLINYAVTNHVIENSLHTRSILDANIMNIFTPMPSQVTAIFEEKYQISPIEATQYFFNLSKKSNYIQTRAIAKNISFSTPTKFGDLEITINLSKPEKTSQQIAQERKSPSSSYPICLLCMENEGYKGRTNHPARANHRIIHLLVDTENWGFQYSPYAYYNEHCIFLSQEHRPMKISHKTFRRLLNIVDQFPHYFVGSNADLPIVGGSILSHDHYQGGQHEFAMTNAPISHEIEIKQFPSVSFGILSWPLSVLRLKSTDIQELESSALHILETWRNYSDITVDILAFSGDTPHNTITPIARKHGNLFELDLVLRNNRTNDQYPDGIFHPHPDLHHIKKENIGLIEVMGLAILPPRLEYELEEVRKFLLNQHNKIDESHLIWALQLKKAHFITEQNATQIINQGIGDVFLKVLEDAGVFKQTDQGIKAFLQFTNTL